MYEILNRLTPRQLKEIATYNHLACNYANEGESGEADRREWYLNGYLSALEDVELINDAEYGKLIQWLKKDRSEYLFDFANINESIMNLTEKEKANDALN